jgi:transcriptional regulator with XRE-family HTH domain
MEVEVNNNLSDLVRRKMEVENLSLRAAGDKVGVAHTTIDRILRGLSVDLETIEKLCAWLGVPVTSVLDIREDSHEIIDQIASALALSPQLSVVFGELAKRVLAGEVEATVLAEVAAFTSYRLYNNLSGDKIDEPSHEEVLLGNRKAHSSAN